MITTLSSKWKIIPVRIKQARIARAMSQEELARSIGVTKQAVSKYETGFSKPSDSVIVKIADTLTFPVEFFEKQPNVTALAQSAPFFRSYKTSSVKNKAAWSQRCELLDDLIISKFKEYIEMPLPNLPNYIVQQSSYTMDECETIALEVRHYWSMGEGPIDNLVDIIQSNGIIIANMDGANKVDAFSTIKNGTPYIFISDDTESSVRWRFSLAHEIGHLVLHSNMFEEDIPEKVHDQIETEANYFASAFLMPQSTFFKDVTVASLDHFLYLKRKWKTSISSMIMKCKNFEVLSPSQTEMLFRKMAINKWRRVEPLDDICISERPYLLKQAIKLLLDNEILATDTIESEFGLYLEDLAQWTFTPIEILKPTKKAPQPLKLLTPVITPEKKT